MEDFLGIDIVYLVCSVVCFVPAVVFHEFAHGFAAFKLGDPTAKMQGRLTLNPLAHIDPFGTVIMPLMLMVCNLPVFGYAKPVPYNPRYFKDKRKGDLIVGLAGPAANLMMACVGALLYHVLVLLLQTVDGNTTYALIDNVLFSTVLFDLVPLFVYVNLVFMFFNLIPIPPLDGSSIFAFILPAKYLPAYYRVQQWALPIFMIVVVLLPPLIGFNPISIYLNVTAYALFDALL